MQYANHTPTSNSHLRAFKAIEALRIARRSHPAGTLHLRWGRDGGARISTADGKVVADEDERALVKRARKAQAAARVAIARASAR